MDLFYVDSYPKSGATWFRLLMYALFHQKIENSNHVQVFYPEVPNQTDLIDRNIEAGNTSFIKSHYAYSEGLPYLNQSTAVIFITRNPFNCMLSKLDHYKYEGVDWVNDKKGMERFCNNFIDEADHTENETPEKIHGGWNHHTTSWFNANLKMPLIHIRYEDLVNDTFAELKKLVEKLGFNFSDQEIQNAVDLTSFSKTRKLEEEELKNETPGMFFSKKRRDNFLSNDQLRFVKMGKKRDAMSSLDPDIILNGKLAFYEGMKLANYS